MISINRLKEASNAFFKDFCKIELVNNPPEWSEKWEFKGELTNNSNKGCYAHLNGNEVVYIGLAISDSNNGSGIGSRVSNYWKYDKMIDGVRNYTPLVENVDSIITLPFENDDYYLAAALEIYLIQKLHPPKNKVHSKI